MTNISIIDNQTKVRFHKLMWHETEIILAKCFNFNVNIETNVIICTIAETSKKALYDFIRICFKNFSEAVSEKKHRDSFFNQLDEIYDFLYNEVDKLMAESLPYNDMMYTHQREVIREAYYKKYNFLAMDMGTGKAQPLDAKVLTPTGFVEMGKIQVNDVVIDKNGHWCVVTGVYPQGKKEIFKITFSDDTVTHSCEEHLWLVSNEGYKHVVHPLGYFKDKLRTSKNLLKWSVPTQDAVIFAQTDESKNLPLHPYALGALIGNGSIINAVNFSCDHSDAPFFINKLEELLPGCQIKKQKGDNYSWNIFNNGTSLNSYVAKSLGELGLFGKRSGEKFIPKIYLYSTIENRIQLLRGLMDTDGHVSKTKSKTSFSTSSPKLRDDFMFLVRSLGGVARYLEDVREGKNTGYQVHVTLKDIIPFSIPRKAELCHAKIRMINRRFKSVESIGEKECQCISVSSPTRTYLTDDFIVTHNTITSASVSRVCKTPRTIIFCPSAVKYNWFRDLVKFGYNEMYFSVLDASRRRTIIALSERFVIINYDIIHKYEPHLLSSEVGHFILDESHNLKSHLSNRTRNVKHIIDQFPNARITFLSGTPIKNRVNDVFSYLKMINHELGKNHKKFLEEFTIRANNRGGEKVTGGKNLQDLNLKMSNFMIRKTKEECLDLPDKVYLSYRFEMDDYRDEYNSIIEELSKVKEVSRLTGNLHSLNIITSKAKIKGIIGIAESILEEGRKVSIFGSYTEPLRELENYFKDRCVKIDGSVPSFERDRLIQKFITEESCTVFIGNMIAAGVGINLTNASDIIFANMPFTPSELYQSIDRHHRIGQKNSVNVHYTFCEDSIDEHIYDIIVDKEKDINAVIDQGKEVLVRESMTEILMKKLLKRDDVELVEDVKYETVGENVLVTQSIKVEDEAFAKHMQSITEVKMDKPDIGKADLDYVAGKLTPPTGF